MLINRANIPGLMIEFKDGGLALKTTVTAPTTKSVLIMGTAEDGPIMNPVAVDGSTNELVFGKSADRNGKPNGATIPEAVAQALREGCDDVRAMRISGTVATGEIKSPISNDNTELQKQETLGVTGGNDEKVFTLGNKLVSSGSVIVKAAGSAISSALFSVNSETGEVTLIENAVNAGSSISINYSYYTDHTEVTENFNPVDGDVSVILANTPLINSMPAIDAPIIQINDVIQSDSNFVVNPATKTITFANIARNVSETFTATGGENEVVLNNIDITQINSITKNGNPLVDGVDYTITDNIISLVANLNNGDEIITDYDYTTTDLKTGDDVEVVYNYVSGTLSEATENSSNGDLWIADATNLQELDLNEQPIAGKIKIYINDKEVVDSNVVTVDYDNKLLLINKNEVVINQEVFVSYLYLDVVESEPTINIESVFGGSVYNDVVVKVINVLSGTVVIDKIIQFTKPLSKRDRSDDALIEYKASDHPTFNQLVNAVNNDIDNGINNIVYLSTEEQYEGIETITLEENSGFSLTGGTNGLNLSKQDLYEALVGTKDEDGKTVKTGAFQLLEDYQVDFIVPMGCYADDQLLGIYQDFARELAMVCAVMSIRHRTHGIISIKPPKKTDLASKEEFVQKIESYGNLYNVMKADGTLVLDPDGNPYDLGGYISVLAGPEVTVISPRLGIYNTDARVQYAALNSRLVSQDAATNKAINSITGLKYHFSLPQLDRIGAKRFVTFHQRDTDDAIVPTDGITAARPNSDWSRIVYNNVVRDVLTIIRNIAIPYIGKAMDPIKNNALNSAITKELDRLSSTENLNDRILEGYKYDQIVDPNDKIIGDTKIILDLVPLGERRRITIKTGLIPNVG